MKAIKFIGLALLIFIITLILSTLLGLIGGFLIHLVYNPFNFLSGAGAGFGTGIFAGLIFGIKLAYDIIYDQW